MRDELSVEVQSFLDTIGNTIDKEIKFIENHPWENFEKLSKRQEAQDLHEIIVKRHVDYSKKLYDTAVKFGDDSNASVKAMIKKLHKTFSIYEKSYQTYTEKQDLGALLEGINDEKVNVKNELAFQSEMTQSITALRGVVMTIARAEDKSRVTIPLHNDAPVPLLMREKFEEKFPEIKEALAAKK